MPAAQLAHSKRYSKQQSVGDVGNRRYCWPLAWLKERFSEWSSVEIFLRFFAILPYMKNASQGVNFSWLSSVPAKEIKELTIPSPRGLKSPAANRWIDAYGLCDIGESHACVFETTRLISLYKAAINTMQACFMTRRMYHYGRKYKNRFIFILKF